MAGDDPSKKRRPLRFVVTTALLVTPATGGLGCNSEPDPEPNVPVEERINVPAPPVEEVTNVGGGRDEPPTPPESTNLVDDRVPETEMAPETDMQPDDGASDVVLERTNVPAREPLRHHVRMHRVNPGPAEREDPIDGLEGL